MLPFANIKTVPIGLFVGKQDPFADPKDVDSFKGQLSTLKFWKEYDNMDHSSFTIGKNMAFMNDVYTLIRQYHTNEEEMFLY